MWVGQPLLVGKGFGIVMAVSLTRRVALVLLQNGKWAEITETAAAVGSVDLAYAAEEVWQ